MTGVKKIGGNLMNFKNSKLFLFIMAGIFIIVGLMQILEGNATVSIFPIICSFIFLYRGFSQHK